jgi:hypothetical protein
LSIVIAIGSLAGNVSLSASSSSLSRWAASASRIDEIVKAQMQGSPRPTVTLYGPTGSRSAKKEKDGNRDVRIPIAGVEDACRLARNQSAVGKSAPGGDITLTDGPPTPSDCFHE